MNWDHIETKWSEMTRRIQAQWPDRPNDGRDGAMNAEPADVPEDAGTAKAVLGEGPTAKGAGIPGKFQGVSRSAQDDRPAAADDASLNLA